jgi:hypothetical protein
MSKISTPKLTSGNNDRRHAWYPYYAGFSTQFVEDCIDELGLAPDALVVDPWNGSGTTTSTLARRGLSGIGFDLNPVMVIVAKARLLGSNVSTSLESLAEEIIGNADDGESIGASEPLSTWFHPKSANYVRAIERSAARALLKKDRYDLCSSNNIDTMSSLAAFYYLALFRAVRGLLHTFRTSNPTWITLPERSCNRRRPSGETVRRVFLARVREMAKAVEDQPLAGEAQSDIQVLMADATRLTAHVTKPVDAFITSPPYCTRIDYAVATRPELAILQLNEDVQVSNLRRALTGGVMIRNDVHPPCTTWGERCLATLEGISSHPSRASSGYYAKQYCQYFGDLATSFHQMRFLSKAGSYCVMVLQDSLYKNIHVDLPEIAVEMAKHARFDFVGSHSFEASHSFRHINSRARFHHDRWDATEKVLKFRAA